MIKSVVTISEPGALRFFGWHQDNLPKQVTASWALWMLWRKMAIERLKARA